MKERLTGAIILVALLVLLVPELLTGPSPKSVANPAGAEGAPLRTYTIDLADDPAAGRPGGATPPSGPTATATDEPVAQASAEPETEGEAEAAPSGAESASAAGEPIDLGVARGSTADPAAAGRASDEAQAAKPGSAGAGSGAKPETAAAAEPERPRSAFGPNAMTRPEPAKPVSSARAAPSTGSASSARTASSASSASSAGSASPPRPSVSSAAAEPVKPPAPKPSAAKGSWAVQLGAFGSRENAERLVKQVKGKGFPVVINENPSSKLRYRVRVGPEKDRAAADALAAKLRAAGHKEATVVPPS